MESSTDTPHLLRSLGGTIRPALPAILLYYAVQVVGVLVLVLMSNDVGQSPLALLGKWDADWFMEIAEHGYNQPILFDAQGSPVPNSLVFFPLYPALIAVLTTVGLPPLTAGLLVTAIAGGLAAWGLFVLGRDLAGPRVGTVLAGLVAAAPGALVLHMAYSEATFLALVAWTLVALRREQWLVAAGLTVLAGLTRSTAGALVVAIVVAALVAIVRRRGGWRPWAAVVLAPLGLLAFLGYVGLRTGRVDGWFWLQGGAWHMGFDWGAFTWERLGDGLMGRGVTGQTIDTLIAVILLAAVALLAWSYTRRLPVAWHVYTTLVLLTALGGAAFWQSRPRFLLPAIGLAIPLALVLAELRRRELAILLPAAALASGWFGAYLITVAQTNP